MEEKSKTTELKEALELEKVSSESLKGIVRMLQEQGQEHEQCRLKIEDDLRIALEQKDEIHKQELATRTEVAQKQAKIDELTTEVASLHNALDQADGFARSYQNAYQLHEGILKSLVESQDGMERNGLGDFVQYCHEVIAQLHDLLKEKEQIVSVVDHTRSSVFKMRSEDDEVMKMMSEKIAHQDQVLSAIEEWHHGNIQKLLTISTESLSEKAMTSYKEGFEAAQNRSAEDQRKSLDHIQKLEKVVRHQQEVVAEFKERLLPGDLSESPAILRLFEINIESSHVLCLMERKLESMEELFQILEKKFNKNQRKVKKIEQSLLQSESDLRQSDEENDRLQVRIVLMYSGYILIEVGDVDRENC